MILGYRGKSFVSKAIRWQTRSVYSHVGVLLDDGSVIEAWHKGGVLHNGHYLDMHTPGTKVDAYRITGAFNAEDAERFLQEQLGKRYDFRSVFRFITRRRAQDNARWFCSELVEAALAYAGLPLLSGSRAEHSPRDTLLSPHLEFSHEMGWPGG